MRRFSTPRKPHAPGARFPLAGALRAASLCLLLPGAAQASISVLQPAKRIDASKPLELTLLVSEDEQDEGTYRLPPTLTVAASADMIPPVQIALQRDGAADSVSLKRGEFRKVHYRAMLPERLRGMVRIEPIGIDASPVLVAVVRPDAGLPPLAASPDLLNAPLADSASKTAPIGGHARRQCPGRRQRAGGGRHPGQQHAAVLP
jgi:hypothetical protein